VNCRTWIKDVELFFQCYIVTLELSIGPPLLENCVFVSTLFQSLLGQLLVSRQEGSKQVKVWL
jgi:hypothetical protein